MKYSELIVLLPCHSLEDFPVHYEGAEAEGLLSAWSALWHPALLTSANNIPLWFRADGPPDNLANRLILIPSSSESLLLAGWAARARNEGATVLRKLVKRDEMVRAALESLDGGDGGVDPELAGDFLALGTIYLFTELLTRQMRYMSNLDEVHLKNETLAAAACAMAGQGDEARQHLRNCFETLLEARERFYPVQAYLVDLTLVAPTTIGASLRRELNIDVPKNVLLSGETAELLSRQEPATLEQLKLALDHKSACLVGGEYQEHELPLLPQEAVLAELRKGLAAYEQSLGARPTVFGRRRFGLTPVLPQILSRLGFDGALHLTLDDGVFPQGDQCKTRWEGLDTSAIDALARLPLDARAPESFLALPRKMGESMDTDHVATVLLAHWPSDTSPFYDDLRRMSRYSHVLGKFITLSDYFQYTDRPGGISKFRPDQYRTPYLKQAVIRKQPDPLSRFAQAHAAAVTSGEVAALETFADLLQGDTPRGSSDSLAERSTAALARLAQVVSGSRDKVRGALVVNPAMAQRQRLVDVTSLESPPNVSAPVLALQRQGDRTWALVDVPPCGFAWLTSGTEAFRPPRGEKPLAHERTLVNEFMQVTIHETTGGIRSIYAPGQRGNRLSQQLAFRLPAARPQPGDLWRDPDMDASYSVMAVDAIEVTASGPAWGEIVSRGRMLDREGKPLARYTQTCRLPRGSKVLQLDIDLEVIEPPRADGWNSYYAARFAWADLDGGLWRGVAGTTQATTAKRLESPEFVEIRQGPASTTLFAGGLPYHRFNGDRMLDTLLNVRGETRQRFSLAIGVDVAHPTVEAFDLIGGGDYQSIVDVPRGASGSSWWFHLDAKNVVATHWEPVVELGQVVGFRVRLLETEGHSGRVHLRCFAVPRSARQCDFTGATLVTLNLADDKVLIDLAANEWAEVEVRVK